MSDHHSLSLLPSVCQLPRVPNSGYPSLGAPCLSYSTRFSASSNMARFSQRQQFPINNNIPPSEIQWIDPFAQARRNSSLDDASIYTSINEQGLCCTSKTAIQAHRSLSVSSDSSSVSQADLDPHALQESGGRGDEETTSSRRRRSSVLVEIEADELPKPKKRRGKNKANAYIGE